MIEKKSWKVEFIRATSDGSSKLYELGAFLVRANTCAALLNEVRSGQLKSLIRLALWFIHGRRKDIDHPASSEQRQIWSKCVQTYWPKSVQNVGWNSWSVLIRILDETSDQTSSHTFRSLRSTFWLGDEPTWECYISTSPWSKTFVVIRITDRDNIVALFPIRDKICFHMLAKFIATFFGVWISTSKHTYTQTNNIFAFL